MRKFISFIVMCAMTLAAVQLTSCKKDNVTAPEQPQIVVEDAYVDGVGGELNIGFVLKGMSGVKPTVQCAEYWVHDITVYDAIIKCQVDANPLKEERTASLDIVCGELTTSITITQGVANSPFVVNISNIDSYGCWAQFTPIKHEGSFFFLVVSESYFSQYERNGDFSGLYEEDYEWLTELAEYNNMAIGDYLAANASIFSADGAEVMMRYTNLTPETNYVAYCYGMDVDGKRTSDICYATFRTEIIATSDIEFSLNVENITANSATITVTPSNDDYYFWTYVSEMDYALYDEYKIMDNMITNILYEVANGADILDIIHTGESSQSPETLWSGTKYHIIAWGMDARANATTQPVNIGTFTTESGGISDECTFEITCPEVKQTDILINVKPSSATTRYMICPVEESICGSYGDEQMAQRLINMEQARFDDAFYGQGVDWSNAEWIFTGEQSVWGRADLDWTFEAGRTYRIYVFGVDHTGTRTTNIARYDQRTADVEKSDMTFTVELVKNVWDHPVIRVTPSVDDEYWIACVMATKYVDWYRNDDGSINDEEMMHMLTEEYFDGQAKYYAKMGTSEDEYYWSSDSEYSLLVCGWAGSNTTPFFEFKFQTPSIPWGESDAAVDVTYYLFNGAELAKQYPMMWAGYEDNCIVYMEYAPNESAAHWYGGVWLPLQYYDMGVDHLVPLLRNDTVSHVDRVWGQYVGCGFDTTYSMSWFAEDAEGKFGEWNYIEFTPTRTEGEGYNMSEPFEFWNKPQTNGAVIIL